MPTTQIFTGRASELLFGVESDYGVPPGGNWTRTLYYDSQLAAAKPFEDDPILGGVMNNTRDPIDPAPGLITAGGNLTVPLDLVHLGYWLKLALGAPSSSGTTGAYTHVFTSGKDQLPSYSAELKTGSAEYRVHSGLAARSLQLALAREAGYRRAVLDLIGRTEAKDDASAGGTPAAIAARSPLPSVIGSLRWNDVIVGKLLSADLTYTTGMDGERYADGAEEDDEDAAAISAVVPTAEPSIAGTIRVRAPESALDDDAIAGTPRAAVLTYQVSATLSLALALPRAFLERSGRPISGPAGTEQSWNLRAAQTSGAPMLTATLKNSVASYA